MEPTPKQNIVLDCIVNGSRRALPFEEARRLFWSCHYAWLQPLDYYRWNVEGHSGAEYVHLKVRPAARRLGILIHSRSTRAVTLSDLEALEGNDTTLSSQTFQQRAARFNGLFGNLPAHLRPFFYYELDVLGAPRQPAYLMHPGRDYILVLGAVNGDNEVVDWTAFLEPPQ